MGETMNDTWLEQCLRAIPRARMAVFGDFCLDAYWHLDPDTTERSVETGRAVRRVRRQSYGLGGAGNIVANLADLGVGAVRAVGLLGDDLFGQAMRNLLRARHVNCEGLLNCQPDWQTPVYGKPMIDGQEQDRIDFGGFNELRAATADLLARQLELAAADSDVVIVNQQIPAGVTTAAMIARINQLVTRSPRVRFIADSRGRAGEFAGCLLKLNAREAARLLGQAIPRDERIDAARARELAAALAARNRQPVFVTRGQDGIIAADGGTVTEIPGVEVRGPVDPVGAGDTALAAMGAVLACGGDVVAAARLANLAASVTVTKLHTTGAATPAEIRAVASRQG